MYQAQSTSCVLGRDVSLDLGSDVISVQTYSRLVPALRSTSEWHRLGRAILGTSQKPIG